MLLSFQSILHGHCQMILMCKVSNNFANGHYEIAVFNEVESNQGKTGAKIGIGLSKNRTLLKSSEYPYNLETAPDW